MITGRDSAPCSLAVGRCRMAAAEMDADDQREVGIPKGVPPSHDASRPAPLHACVLMGSEPGGGGTFAGVSNDPQLPTVRASAKAHAVQNALMARLEGIRDMSVI